MTEEFAVVWQQRALLLDGFLTTLWLSALASAAALAFGALLSTGLMSRRRVDSHEHEIRAAAHDLLDRLTDREFNLAETYTRALPVITICRELSLPVGFEEEFLGWGQAQKQADDTEGARARPQPRRHRSVDTCKRTHLHAALNDGGGDHQWRTAVDGASLIARPEPYRGAQSLSRMRAYSSTPGTGRRPSR